MRAIVVGAGPGGLVAAIALRQAGHDVAIYDRADVLEPIGAGLALYHNAMRVLGTLGLGDAVAAAGVVFEKAELRTAQGEVLTRGDVSGLTRKLGVPAICIHRADLQRVLLEALGDSGVHLAHACIGFTQDGAGVTARFANGGEAQGDLLIGADGLHSVLRAQLLGNEPPRYAGYAAWRGIAAIEPSGVPPRTGFEGWGRGMRFGLFRVSGGRVYWFAVANMPEGGIDPPGGRKRDMLDRIRGWQEPVPSVVDATDESAILRHDIYDRPPVTRWGKGRVTLLGDAAHPMTPNLAQGAGTAIEDGEALARWLGQQADVPTALRSYEHERQARTAPLVTQSRRIGQVGQVANPFAAAIRNFVVKRTPASITNRQLESVVTGGR